jgi:RimJ/RimL family protein N-acetyltransferase
MGLTQLTASVAAPGATNDAPGGLVAVDLREPVAASRTIERRRSTLVPSVDYPTVRPDHLRERDLRWMVGLLADPDIAWYEPLPVPQGDPRAEDLVRGFIRRSGHPSSRTAAWLILENGRRVGVAQLRRLGEGRLVGVSLAPAVRGRGMGTALFRALAAFATQHVGAEYVAGEVEDDNLPSIGALHKAGYLAEDRYPTTLDNGRQTVVTRFVSR